MSKVEYLQTNFTSGEIAPKLYGRVDIQKYRNGVKTERNFLTMVEGGARKRGGTKFMIEARDDTGAPRLIRWQYNLDQVYMLEVTRSGYIRFHIPGSGILTETAKNITGATAANPCVITSAAHGFSNGDRVVITGVVGMTALNNRHYAVANVTTNTFQLTRLADGQPIDASAYDAYSSAGSVAKIVEVAHPYSSTQIESIDTAQSADVLYITHTAHPIYQLTRTSATAFTMAEAAVEGGPFRTINADETVTVRCALATPAAATITNATQALPCVITTNAAHGWQTGETVDIAAVVGMTELNGNRYRVVVLTTTTASLQDERGQPINSNSYTAYGSGGTATSADTGWSTLSPGSKVTITASSGIFTSNHVGGLFRVWEGGQSTGIGQPAAGDPVTDYDQYTTDAKVYGVINLTGTATWQARWQYPTHTRGSSRVETPNGNAYFDAVYLHNASCTLEITAYTSATVVTARIVGDNHLPKSFLTTATRESSFFEFGAWSAEYGYPKRLTFHSKRLWLAGSTSDPQTLWSSRQGAFLDFRDGTEADAAIVASYGTDNVELPVWLKSAGRVLIMGTASGEFPILASSQKEALAPDNIQILKDSAVGSAGVGTAITVGSTVVFLQRDGDPNNPGRRLRQLAYSFERDAFDTVDLSLLASHMGLSAFRETAYSATPDSIIWVRKANGDLVGFTFEAAEEIRAWHLHDFENGDVRRIATAPGETGEELWAVIERVIDGSAYYYIEVLTEGLDDNGAKEDATFLDSHLVYDGASTTTISGLFHLRGETLGVLADGAVQADVTVDTQGKVTIERAASVVCLGYHIDAELETLDFEAGAQTGTAQGRPKRISEAQIRFHRTAYARFGKSTSDTMDEVQFRDSTAPMGSSVALFSGLKRVQFPAGWDREAAVTVVSDKPLPCSVLGIQATLNVTG